MIYTGIGSRSLPTEIWNQMLEFGSLLGRNNITLRSGAAEGADTAFERGCDVVGGPKEIYLPWKEFNDNESKLYNPSQAAYDLAQIIHPTHFSKIGNGAQLMHARNSHQILGYDMMTPTDFVICYTHDGCESYETRTQHTGGTGQAIEIASRMHIPIFNLANKERIQHVYEFLYQKGVVE